MTYDLEAVIGVLKHTHVRKRGAASVNGGYMFKHLKRNMSSPEVWNLTKWISFLCVKVEARKIQRRKVKANLHIAYLWRRISLSEKHTRYCLCDLNFKYLPTVVGISPFTRDPHGVSQPWVSCTWGHLSGLISPSHCRDWRWTVSGGAWWYSSGPRPLCWTAWTESLADGCREKWSCYKRWSPL